MVKINPNEAAELADARHYFQENPLPSQMTYGYYLNCYKHNGLMVRLSDTLTPTQIREQTPYSYLHKCTYFYPDNTSKLGYVHVCQFREFQKDAFEAQLRLHADLGIAEDQWYTIKNETDNYFTYQIMMEVGTPLLSILEQNPTAKQRLHLAIQFLIALSKLYAGQLSKTNKPIYPANLMIENVYIKSSGEIFFKHFHTQHHEPPFSNALAILCNRDSTERSVICPEIDLRRLDFPNNLNAIELFITRFSHQYAEQPVSFYAALLITVLYTPTIQLNKSNLFPIKDASRQKKLIQQYLADQSLKNLQNHTMALCFFQNNPTAQKTSRENGQYIPTLSASYLKLETGILKLHHRATPEQHISRGWHSMVKRASLFFNGTVTPCVLKRQIMTTERLLKILENHHRILQDLGLLSQYMLREAPYTDLRGEVQQKAYHIMPHLGASLSAILKQTPSLNKCIRLAIALLSAIRQLHTGENSKTKTGYAHLDIKPDNILIDDEGNLHLIDFEFATCFSTSLDEQYKICGTLYYQPIDLKDLIYQNKTTICATLKQQPPFSLLIRDKIATCRTLYIPDGYHTPSIFNDAAFHALPPCIQSLINSETIAPLLIGERATETMLFLEACFILFYQNMKITQLEIDELRSNEEKQRATCNKYHPSSTQLTPTTTCAI